MIVGSARDIVEHCGAPRFLFTDFPLGNPCGRPYDAAMQLDIAGRALALLEEAAEPRTLRQTPFRWDGDAWRRNYLHIDDAQREKLRLAGEKRRAAQHRAKVEGTARSD